MFAIAFVAVTQERETEAVLRIGNYLSCRNASVVRTHPDPKMSHLVPHNHLEICLSFILKKSTLTNIYLAIYSFCSSLAIFHVTGYFS